MSSTDFYRDIARYCRRLLKEKGGSAGTELGDQLQQWALECDGQADHILQSAPARARLDQARRHRQRAEEYHAVAEQMQTPAARESYRHLAQSYEAMARRLEVRDNAAQRSGEKAG